MSHCLLIQLKIVLFKLLISASGETDSTGFSFSRKDMKCIQQGQGQSL